MTKTLMTFGDSNTFGTPPITIRGLHHRHASGVRWPTVTQSALGPGWTLVEEGLPGRTAKPASDPVMGAHMNGHFGLRIALASHGPLDMLTIMLGTNDLKGHFAPTPAQITGDITGLLEIAQSDDALARHPEMQILLICPPPVRELGTFKNSFPNAAEISAALPSRLSQLARQRGVAFLDAGLHAQSCDEDGIHLDSLNHKALGQAVADKLRDLI